MRFLYILFYSTMLFAGPKILVVPDYEGYVDTMFPGDPLPAYGNLSVWGKVKYHLQKCGYEITGSNLSQFADEGVQVLEVMQQTSQVVEKVVILNVPRFVNLARFVEYPEGSLVLVVFEPPAVDAYLHSEEYLSYFDTILTWDDERVDGDRFVKFFYPVMYPMKAELIPFAERSLCTMIARNKRSSYEHEIYSERLRALAFFEKNAPDDFALYGHGWEHLPLATYRGSVDDKYATLMQYKFSICYENTQNIEGYITEKIFDCFHCGVIPIYLGASNITSYIPPECFIDKRDFSSYEALYAYLTSMSKEEHEGYLQAIRSYLQTDDARKFSDEYFVETFLEHVLGIPHTP